MGTQRGAYDRNVNAFKPGETTRMVKGMTDAERAMTRMEIEAERILINVMLRRNWSAELRDELAEELVQIVNDEIEARAEDREKTVKKNTRRASYARDYARSHRGEAVAHAA